MRARTIGLIAFALLPALPASARPISLEDSFRLGAGPGILCSAQVANKDPALLDMFDRAYSITCRDASVPVGRLYALKIRGADPAARLTALRGATADCGPVGRTSVDTLGQVDLARCTLRGQQVGYHAYLWRQRDTLYVAEGLAGYDSALRLGLRTLVADKPVPGEIQIATTEAGDASSFARAQASSLDAAAARDEAYRRNNAGNYAESAEFFAALIAADPAVGIKSEALVNQAVQQSNLGNFAEAANLFEQAEDGAASDPVVARMLRNYRAIHFINQSYPDQALAELDKPLPASAQLPPREGTEPMIDSRTAAKLNAQSAIGRRLAGTGTGLLPEERAEILDAQTQHLRGTALRLQKDYQPAEAALRAATAQLERVRNGRVTTVIWMRGQIMGELAAIAEAGGYAGEAERLHQAAVSLLATDYPGSPALLSAQARLAVFYARNGRKAPARDLFRQIVEANAQSGTSSQSLRRSLRYYFDLLAEEADAKDVADMFKASQILVRPGVAQTQAVMARELSGGSDEAARLFRQSLTLTRDIERTRVEISRLAAATSATPADAVQLDILRSQLHQLELDQVATQAKLAEFPRYRVVSGGAMELAELQNLLRPGESYYKMTVVGDRTYAIFATAESARALRIAASPADLEREVDALRNTISRVEDGQLVTVPFDVARANTVFGHLFGEVQAELAQANHLIFEPDGAMLRLPPNLLVVERTGVDTYLTKAGQPANDGFDFTDIQWLGRGRDVSTSVSARSFRDIRRLAPSRATQAYIGFGENAPPEGTRLAAGVARGLLDESSTCSWPLTEWAKPISAAELLTARRGLAREGAGEGEIVTGEAFTDSAVKQREDLNQYRIMHFATHGLVAAPRPECPARPALMTSFGSEGSDGLLSFSEIFDLRIDADLVILSACDTAGKASLAATREAGLRTGGDFALDGLVRAFVGAGGRSVVASHWPVPDDYDATTRLISGLFTAPAGTATATALRNAQEALMSSADTSHPYYWSGFAIIGDGSAPVIPKS